ncbi:MAG: GatB/YqeY domain-containing protein [Actinobacteria bacterium]|nr:GatB/YqeY domain-containing protein [Actinomycetota bacterium]
MRDALRAGEKLRLSTLRLLAAAVKNREVELRREVSADEFVEVVVRQVKQRKEAAEAYGSGGRPELAEKERTEQAILETYLPEQLSEEDLSALVDEAVAATGASEPGDLGKVMGYVMQRARGRADGRAVQAAVRGRLGAGS